MACPPNIHLLPLWCRFYFSRDQRIGENVISGTLSFLFLSHHRSVDRCWNYDDCSTVEKGEEKVEGALFWEISDWELGEGEGTETGRVFVLWGRALFCGDGDSRSDIGHGDGVPRSGNRHIWWFLHDDWLGGKSCSINTSNFRLSHFMPCIWKRFFSPSCFA